MTVTEVPDTTLTRRQHGRAAGVSELDAYLTGPHPQQRAVTLSSSGPLWYLDWLEGSLNQLRALPPGWDGHRAPPITDEAVVAIVVVLQTLLNQGSVPPQLVPLPDGGVQADWLVAGNTLEIEAAGDGDVYLFAADADGTVVIEGPGDERTVDLAARRLDQFSARVATVR